MNKAIVTALTYLNEIEVRGERNCTLLAAAIKALKPLQAPAPTEPSHEADHQP